MQVRTVIAPAAQAQAQAQAQASAAVADPVFYFSQIWPPAIIAFGIGLTVAWVSLLGYGLVEVIALAF
jgi:hypothetical protein